VPDVIRQAFMRYPWPGNVRELENACERIAQTCSCGIVGVGCLSFEMLAQDADQPIATPLAAVLPHDPTPISLDDRLRELESSLITWALKVSSGNKSRAAELLRIKRSTLGDRINRCRLNDNVESGSAASEMVEQAVM
jgi:DNA-binding NtrC family response regulator